MKSDHPYLAHIADAIAAIETYVAGGREAFMRERLIQDGVIRNFEILARPPADCHLASETHPVSRGPRSSRSATA